MLHAHGQWWSLDLARSGRLPTITVDTASERFLQSTWVLADIALLSTAYWTACCTGCLLLMS